MKKRWIILVFLIGCLGQTPSLEFRELSLTPGTGETYEFYQEGVLLGTSSYTVEKKDTYEGVDAFFIHEKVDLQGSGYTISIDASYIVDTTGLALYYEFSATVNGETQTMEAEFGETHVHEVAHRPDKDFDKEIRIGEHTFTLDNNMIGQWDIIFSALHFTEGDTIVANAYAAQPMTTFTIKGTVLEEVQLSVGEKVYTCYKMDFSTPPYYMYVTAQGQLLKLETKDGKLIIILKQ
ncbi:MAG: hypothetical protein HXS53_04510 [Theionarchaea archaeon]|nr:hypothetical protein [Theionarchaea archaeon]